jgi:hypothetical protein
MTSKLTAVNSQGYKIFSSINNLKRQRQQNLFYKSNPYTIENIKDSKIEFFCSKKYEALYKYPYCESVKRINTELISKEFKEGIFRVGENVVDCIISSEISNDFYNYVKINGEIVFKGR